MRFREGCSHAGDHVGGAALMGRDDIHVAFDDDRRSTFPDAAVCTINTVKDTSLVEQRRLRRVEVFGLAIIQHAPPKTDDMAL